MRMMIEPNRVAIDGSSNNGHLCYRGSAILAINRVILKAEPEESPWGSFTFGRRMILA